MLMTPLRLLAGSVVLVIATLVAAPAEAVFHFWYIKEVYSNHDGSVQFIELFTANAGQDETIGEKIVTGSGNTYTFTGNVTNPTTNRHLLLATASFDAVPGSPTPDFATNPLPPNFFDPNGDTIQFLGTLDGVKSFTSAPIDGLNSLNWPGFGNAGMTTAPNSPTNRAGSTGQINLPPPQDDPTGDYNQDGAIDAADYVMYRKTFGDFVEPDGSGADGNGDGEINEEDYTYWVQRFGEDPDPGAAPGAIPEPATIILSLIAGATLSHVRRRRS
jgi:hypothetical protein